MDYSSLGGGGSGGIGGGGSSGMNMNTSGIGGGGGSSGGIGGGVGGSGGIGGSGLSFGGGSAGMSSSNAAGGAGGSGSGMMVVGIAGATAINPGLGAGGAPSPANKGAAVMGGTGGVNAAGFTSGAIGMNTNMNMNVGGTSASSSGMNMMNAGPGGGFGISGVAGVSSSGVDGGQGHQVVAPGLGGTRSGTLPHTSGLSHDAGPGGSAGDGGIGVADPSSQGGVGGSGSGGNVDNNMVLTGASSGQSMHSMHMDYVHHIAFDVYGRRMATCSGDRFVRVWDLTDKGEWEMVGEWQAHRSGVTMLCWAHPEFGALLATCASDHDAKIWEERNATATTGSSTMPPSNNNLNSSSNNPHHQYSNSGISMGAMGGGGGMGPGGGSSRWILKTQLTDSRKAVSCIEFAPRHLGLKLATGSMDGCVRIYEAVDIMNLSQWPLAATLQVYSGAGNYSSSTTDSNSYGCLGVQCLSWCTGRFEPPTLVVGGSNISIYRYSDQARNWQPIMQLPSAIQGKKDHILDVAWAPNVGRRYHYIAAAEDQRLRVFKLNRDASQTNTATAGGDNNTVTTATNSSTAGGGGGSSNEDGGNTTQPTMPGPLLELETDQTLPTNAWRCQWNITGTVLASSGDGGMVQLWKPDFDGNFHCVSQTMADLSQVAPGQQQQNQTNNGATTVGDASGDSMQLAATGNNANMNTNTLMMQ